MADTLRVGVIGLGVGFTHAKSFAANDRCEVRTVCDLSEEKLRQAVEVLGEVKTTTVAEEILVDPDIDVVVVASHDDDHHSQIAGALLNDKHVFAEKPLTLHRDEAHNIRSLLDAHPGKRLTSNLCLRTCPLFFAVKEAVRSGAMGPVFSLEGDYLWGRKQKLMGGWRPEMEFYSIIHGAAVHMIDLLMWLTGERVVEVHSLGNAMATRGGRLRFNDFASLNLRFASGAVGRVSANGGCVHPHFHRLAVFGRDKTFLHDLAATRWLVPGEEGPVSVFANEAYPARESRVQVVDSFVEALLGDAKAMIVDESAAFDTMSVCFAADESVRTGKPVAVEYI